MAKKKPAYEIEYPDQQLDDPTKLPEENPNPVIRAKKDGTIVFANAACSLLGLSEFRRGAILPARYRQLAAKTLETGESRVIEADGTQRIFMLNFVPIMESGYVNIYGSDITERKKVEKQLQELVTSVQQERDRLSALLKSIPDEVWFADTRGNFTLANPSALREFALDSSKSVGVEDLARGLEVYRPDGSARPVKETPPLRALKGEIIENQEEIIRTPASRELRYRQVSAAPVRDPGGNIIGSVSVARDITEFKKAEKFLKETRDYLESLINYANAPIIVWDTEFGITRFNRAFERLTGLSEKEVLGKKLAILFPEDSKAATTRLLRNAAPGKHWELVEIPIQRVDGSVRTLLWNSATILSADGKTPVATIAQGQDITERKQAEEALVESLHDLNRAQAVAQTGSWRLDAEHDVLLWSDETYRMFGIPKGSSMNYETFLSYVHPDDREYVNRKWKAALEGKKYDIEHRIVVENKVRWVRERAELEFDKEGLPKGGFGTVEDITRHKREQSERERLNDELADRFNELQSVLDTAPVAIWICRDPKCRNITGNAYANELFGVEQGTNLSGSAGHGEAAANYRVFYDGVDMNPDRLPARVAATTGKPVPAGEFEIVFETGRRLHMLISAVPLMDSQGRVRGSVAIGADITEQKLEMDIKDEFIGMVSHELRTPLTVIIGALSTAADERVSKEEKDELLGEATSSAESLASILSNMLELSRYRAGRLELEKKPVKISDIAERAVRRARRNYDTHKIILDISDKIPAVNVDAGRIEQVLYNLLENAIKYSPAGGEVRLSSRRGEDGLVIGVRDYGVGIAPEDQEKLFQPFARLNGDVSGGVGLGLVVCKRLVEAHGGRIWIASAPGKGSTFFFTIPTDKKVGRGKPRTGD